MGGVGGVGRGGEGGLELFWVGCGRMQWGLLSFWGLGLWRVGVEAISCVVFSPSYYMCDFKLWFGLCMPSSY